MATVDIFPDVSFSGGAEGLECVVFTFFHLIDIWTFHDWNTLSCVDLIAFDAMSAQVLDSFDFVSLVLDFDLVRLHGLLDRLTDLTKSCIDARVSDAGVCRILDSL